MKLTQIRRFLEKKYTKVEPFPTMFILNDYDGFEATKEICDDLITEMYVVKGLTYVTLEKEDPTLKDANILRIFSYTRGLDIPSPELMDDLVEAKYGKKFRFFGKKDTLNTILGWQSPGIWRVGVQFLQYELEHDMIDDVTIEAAIEFSERFAGFVSSITPQDLRSPKSDLRQVLLDKATDTYRNLQARYFEMCVQEFLRSKYGYTDVVTRYKPPYLKGKEIDVYASKGRIGELKRIIICECKLRFEEREIRLEEIDSFLKVASKVRQHESALKAKEGGSAKVVAWLVTNSTVSVDALETLQQNMIRVMITQLSSNWQKREDWKIIDIKEYHK